MPLVGVAEAGRREQTRGRGHVFATRAGLPAREGDLDIPDALDENKGRAKESVGGKCGGREGVPREEERRRGATSYDQCEE